MQIDPSGNVQIGSIAATGYRLAVDGKFTAADALAAIDGHVLGEASIVAKYKINPSAQEL